MLQRSLRLTGNVAKTLLGFILIKDYIVEVAQCRGASMEPTFNDSGDVILIEKLSVALRNLKRGDVIVTTSPENPSRLICKRIIAMEGDVIAQTSSLTFSTIQIPRGHIWIEGDNRESSRDSRAYGPVPIGLVRGKVYCKVSANHPIYLVKPL